MPSHHLDESADQPQHFHLTRYFGKVEPLQQPSMQTAFMPKFTAINQLMVEFTDDIIERTLANAY